MRQSQCEPYLKQLGVVICQQSATETVRSPCLRHVIFSKNSCILCEVWDSCCGVAENSVLLGCDFSKDRTAFVVSVKQRRVVALHGAVCYTDIDTATFIFGHYFD